MGKDTTKGDVDAAADTPRLDNAAGKDPSGLKDLVKGSEQRALVVAKAESQIGTPDTAPYYENAMPVGTKQWDWPRHWCGIFCLWALHCAGLARQWFWCDGNGFLYRLPTIKDPQPGDIAYFSRYQHHAIVVRVDGDQVETIDGNQAGGAVKRCVRSIHSVAAFYSIQPLLVKESP